MSAKRIFLLILAIVGGAIPFSSFMVHFYNEGVGAASFFGPMIANPISVAHTSEVLFGSFILWTFMAYERSRGKGPNPILFVVINIIIGPACALASYLFAREPEWAVESQQNM